MVDSAKALLRRRLQRAMELTNSLAGILDDGHLSLHLGDLRSNAVGDQFWCVVGARESYVAAIRAGGWSGFSCSLDAAGTRCVTAVAAALAESGAAVRGVFDSPLEFDEARCELVVDLLEHEAQHQGQFIRYFYANGIAFPADFAQRFALSE